MEENQAPVFISIALNSMLKTTTETGDIGQFAIRPSRIRPSRKATITGDDHMLRKPQTSFQLALEQQGVDDRRRLPSYARDATSEIVSLYETPSQKAFSSPRVFETPDHRSHSMTQTSYSSNALSNYRSYASLRSQPELGLIPRPQSPFPYPARLKRVGFRPSSPILIEGGRSDRYHNVEQRHMSSTASASVRSLPTPSTHFKRPYSPLKLQLDSNRTVPIQMGQLHSRSVPFPLSVRSGTDAMRASKFHPEPTISKTSLTINNFEYASTPVNYHRRSPTSFTTASSKSYTPSPLYYDYTEDFNLERVRDVESAINDATSSLPFVPNRSIKEFMETAVEELPEYVSSTKSSPDYTGPRNSVISSCDDDQISPDDPARINSEHIQVELSTNVTRDIIPLYMDRRQCESMLPGPSEFLKSPGSGPRTIIEDQALKSSDYPGLVDDNLKPSYFRKEGEVNYENTAERISCSDRASSMRLSTYLPNFPKPPDQKMHVNMNIGHQVQDSQVRDRFSVDDNIAAEVKKNSIHAKKEGFKQESQVTPGNLTKETPCQMQLDLPFLPLQRSATSQTMRIRSSRYYSIDHGLSDLAQLISNFELASRSITPQEACTESTESTMQLSVLPLKNQAMPGFPTHPSVLLNKKPSQLSPSLESSILLHKFRSDGDLRGSISTPFKTRSFDSRPELMNTNSCAENAEDAKEIPSLYGIPSSLISKTTLALSGLPLNAPQAISPVRILKLKNSVPQLMKALPPAPRDSIFGVSSLKPVSPHGHPSISSPKDFEYSNSFTEIKSVQEETLFIQSLPLQQDLEDVPSLEQIYPTPARFRIKSKFFDAQRSHSPAGSRPWNLDENYPWHGQQPTIRLSPLRSMLSRGQSSPKFKLRVTRSSISPSGTIRINPEARSSLDLRSPKDLFTSSSGISGIFRQVGRQLSSKTSRTAGETTLGNSVQAVFTEPIASKKTENYEDNPNLLRPPITSAVLHPMSPTEVQSFFSEDSSQVRAHHSLRKRISNLRARLPNPYSSRTASQIKKSEGHVGQTPSHALAITGSGMNLNSKQEDQYGMPVSVFRRGKVRSKVSGWFQDVGSAMRRRVKLRNKGEVCCLPYR